MTALTHPGLAPAEATRGSTPAASASTPAPREDALTFACEGETLMGVLHHPVAGAPPEAAATGVVVIVGGPQYRAGSHRQFVHLARALAAAGHPVLRFDVRGMGDSTGTLHHFEQITPDIGAAIDALQHRAPGVERVVLWGLCDGASAALLYLHDRQDARVRGLCLLNPWVRSEHTQAQARLRHYYLDRLRSPDFWRKALTGRVGVRSAGELLASLRALTRPAGATASLPLAPYTDRMAGSLARFTGRVHIALSERDYTAREFEERVRADGNWTRALSRTDRCLEPLPDADHTFSTPSSKGLVASRTVAWVGGFS